jgi:PAS domain S-box-containing protein
MSEIKICLETVKYLTLTINKFSLYAKNHPIVKQSLEQIFDQFKQLFPKFDPATFSLRGEDLFCNEISLPKGALGVKELIAKFKELQVDSISFKSNLEIVDLENLITLLGAGKKLDSQQQKIKDDLFAGNLSHIKVNVIHYEKIEEGQKVVSDVAKEAEEFIKKSKPISESKDYALETFANFLIGKTTSESLDEYSKDIALKLLKDPAALVNIIIQSAVSCDVLEGIFDKLKTSILDSLAVEFVGTKRKPDTFLGDLEQRILKSLADKELSGKLNIKKEDVADVIAKFSDTLKMHILEKLLLATKQDSEKFFHAASRIISTSEELSRFSPQLKTMLFEAGIKSDDCNILFAKLETTFEGKEKITISKSEYDQLKNKASLFDKTLLERINEATEELKKKNKRLANEKERVDTVIRNLAEGLIVVNNQGRVVMINPAAEELLGIDKNKKIGQPLLESLASHQLVALTKGNLSDEEGLFSKEIELNSPDEQTKKTLRASTAVVENENGNTVGMVLTLSDVTRQRQVERMKTDFTSHMSHELRTPIIAAQKSISLLLSQAAGNLNTDQDKFLNIANSNLSRLSRLIDAILDVAKIESGRLKLNNAVFNMSDLINEVCESLSSWAKDKRLSLETDFANNVLEVEADRDKINQVLTNLVGNALKFTPQEGKILVSCKFVPANDQLPVESIQISVTDNGIGISKEDCLRIFNKFEQVSLVSPAGVGGTGLGLYISKEIIQLHNGRIWVESELEKGSTFIFILPKKFSPAQETNAAG